MSGHQGRPPGYLSSCGETRLAPDINAFLKPSTATIPARAFLDWRWDKVEGCSQCKPRRGGIWLSSITSLTPSAGSRNPERELVKNAAVIDRTGLILDIFASAPVTP